MKSPRIRRTRIDRQTKIELAIDAAMGVPAAASARDRGVSRESRRKMAHDPLWCHQRDLARKWLAEGRKFHVILRELLDVHFAPPEEREEQPEQVSYGEFCDWLVDLLEQLNAKRAARGQPLYTATKEALDALVRHHTGEDPEVDARRSVSVLIEILAFGGGEQEPDEISIVTEKKR